MIFSIVVYLITAQKELLTEHYYVTIYQTSDEVCSINNYPIFKLITRICRRHCGFREIVSVQQEESNGAQYSWSHFTEFCIKMDSRYCLMSEMNKPLVIL